MPAVLVRLQQLDRQAERLGDLGGRRAVRGVSPR
jgi:hypothetical protein